jgi:putative ABC transport system substrate-binding protein
MRRRDFMRAIGVAAASWPIAARAQQPVRMRRIGVLFNFSSDDAEGQARNAAFLQGLQEHGWAVGVNIRIDARWATTNAAEIRRHAAELVALAPDVILATGGSSVGALLQVTRRVPVVFPNAIDPVGAGIVQSLERPGGNVTGFMTQENNVAGKWLEILKDIAPRVTRAAVLRNSDVSSGPAQFGIVQAAAPSLKMSVTPVNVFEVSAIERAVAAFARSPNGGLIITAASSGRRYRDSIIGSAARHKLPAVYPARLFAFAGGLISYGPDQIRQYRHAASYIDRILRGEKPADLPVQAPTKYELVINLKTAKALGLTVPPTLLARADEVIE